MLVTEGLAGIEKMMPVEKAEAVSIALDRDASIAGDGYRAEEIDGQLLLVSPRVIQQAEVDALLEDFP